MNLLSKIFYSSRRVAKFLKLFALIAGPGIIVMIADNDAGGITTYAVTGAKYGYNLIWFLILLGPVAYVVQVKRPGQDRSMPDRGCRKRDTFINEGLC